MDGARRSGVWHSSWHAPLLSQEHIISILQCFDGSGSELEVQVRCKMQHATCDENHDATCIMQRAAYSVQFLVQRTGYEMRRSH
jgi:hypothetical protein